MFLYPLVIIILVLACCTVNTEAKGKKTKSKLEPVNLDGDKSKSESKSKSKLEQIYETPPMYVHDVFPGTQKKSRTRLFTEEQKDILESETDRLLIEQHESLEKAEAHITSVTNNKHLTGGKIKIKVYWHVIMDKRGGGGFSKVLVRQQIALLNEDYKNTNFRFILKKQTNTRNNNYFKNFASLSVEKQAKKKLRRGGWTDLNVYSVQLKQYLGWAYFGDTALYLDGVVIAYDTCKGQKDTPLNGHYSLSRTLTHEVGHWFRLYHTFDGGCSSSNDRVNDTPAEASPNLNNCNTNRDTCSSSGNDPINNYMDYSPDWCMSEFTNQQNRRMVREYKAWRQNR